MSVILEPRPIDSIVLYPPEIVAVTDPIIFLNGPIQGGPPWHQQAIELIDQACPAAAVIACPKRLGGEKGKFEAKKYDGQVDWEIHYRTYAKRHGVNLFWLANEAVHDCGRSYAQTTRFELPEAMMWHIYEDAELVVGIDSNFSGARYIRRRFGQLCPEVGIYDNLKETCWAAAKVVRRTL